MNFDTTLKAFGNNTGIVVPPAVIEALGGGKRPAVAVTINGKTINLTLGAMNGDVMIPVSAANRALLGVRGGDALTVAIALDTAPKVIEVPEDLAAAIAAAGAQAAWDKLAPSAKKAHVVSVEGAKAADTRQRRVEKAVASLG